MPGIDTLLTRMFKSRLFPTALQLLTVSFYFPMLCFLLFGPAHKDNPANLLIWLVWWPMLCVLFLFAGRIWCGYFCPFALLSTWAQRAAGLRLAVPDFFKQHSGWLMLIAFFFLFWMEEIKFVMDSPRKTAVVLLSMLTGALICGLLFRGLAWCRNLCPLGAISHVYAHAALFKIRSNEAACAECITKDCVVPDAGYAGYAGCPMQLTPFAMDSVANCRFCGDCVKRCPSNSLQVAFEAPSRDLAGKTASTPALVWFVALLSGFISFLNAMKSQRLPLEAWMQTGHYPVLLKTVLMAGAMAASCLLFRLCVRLAARGSKNLSGQQLLLLGAMPMIPLLLFTHFGYLCTKVLNEGGKLVVPLADLMGIAWLRMDPFWGPSWTQYFSPLCILLGLAFALGILRWAMAGSSMATRSSAGLLLALFYSLFAAWNLFAAWPAAAAAHKTVLELATASPPSAVIQDGWSILWPFMGINAAVLVLVVIARRQQPDGAEKIRDFSASRSWVIGDASRQTEMLDWLVEQAIQAQWRIPAMVKLGYAAQEIITFLQRTLPAGASITANAILRKNKAVMTISHTGQPLILPDYKAPPSLEDDTELDGIELSLAVAQVDAMSYQARLSEGRCSFTLRQAC